MTKRQYIKIGYQADNGHTFSQIDCKIYNNIQVKINTIPRDNKELRDYYVNFSNVAYKLITSI